jgi:hypothetical protein
MKNPASAYTNPSRISQSTAVIPPPRNAYTKCSAPLKSNSHPTTRVTTIPATSGDAIARKPAMIISTLSAMDHPATRRTSDKNDCAMSPPMTAADRPLTLAAAILIPGRIVEGRRKWSRHSDFADVDGPTTDGKIDTNG